MAVETMDGTKSSQGVTLSWRDLSVYAIARGRRNGCKQLINNVRGAAKPGDLTAIVGGSGAGKSTLMTALAFRTGPGFFVHGDVRANGVSVDSSYMMRNSGYMHQEDLFVESMTVVEHLWFMARMKLDRRTRIAEIRERVDQLLQDFGLTNRRDAKIGGTGVDEKLLSGGEKKRLAFATELLTDPKILFLDEPTTGQDSHTAGLLVSQLTSFVAKGRTVLCTIHQPSSAIYDSFDRVILIAGGRIAFAGTTERAMQFFVSQGYECPRNYNPADFLIATVATRPGNIDGERAARQICDAFLTSDACNEIDLIIHTQLLFSLDPSADRPSNPCTFKEPRCYSRLYWLVYRGFLQVLRDPSVQTIRILQKLSVATIAGLCFVGAVNRDQLGIQATQGVIFILVSENAFFPMYATLALIPEELPLLRREYRAGMYPVHLYYLARMLSLASNYWETTANPWFPRGFLNKFHIENVYVNFTSVNKQKYYELLNMGKSKTYPHGNRIPGLILEPLLFTTIIYWLAGMRDTSEAFGLSLIVLLLTMNVSTACGCFFSAAFDSVPLAMAYLVPFDYVLMITMGPFVKLGSLPIYVRWVKYVSWLLHSSEALTIIQWKDVHNISCETTEPELPCLTDGSEVLHRYDFDENNLWTDMLFMFLIYFIFHLLGCACLWRRCRSS